MHEVTRWRAQPGRDRAPAVVRQPQREESGRLSRLSGHKRPDSSWLAGGRQAGGPTPHRRRTDESPGDCRGHDAGRGVSHCAWSGPGVAELQRDPQARGVARSRCDMNSSRVSFELRNAPRTLLVTIVAPPFWTPRIARHKCSASMTTPEP